MDAEFRLKTKTIFPKEINKPKNWFVGVLKPAEHEFGNDKFS